MLTGGAAAGAAAAVPAVEAWAQVWSKWDREKKKEAIARHHSRYEYELAGYLREEELDDEEIDDLNKLILPR